MQIALHAILSEITKTVRSLKSTKTSGMEKPGLQYAK
jgi:hypothetical protein